MGNSGCDKIHGGGSTREESRKQRHERKMVKILEDKFGENKKEVLQRHVDSY